MQTNNRHLLLITLFAATCFAAVVTAVFFLNGEG